MIAIYTQDGTLIRKDAENAKKDLVGLYGEKLGIEAYNVIKSGHIGASYRKYGGPLIKVISQERAEEIKKKELAGGMEVY